MNIYTNINVYICVNIILRGIITAVEGFQDVQQLQSPLEALDSTIQDFYCGIDMFITFIMFIDLSFIIYASSLEYI